MIMKDLERKPIAVLLRWRKPGAFLVTCLLLFLTACYTDYVTLHFKIHHSATWNDDSTRVAMFITTKAFRAPKGIARFPDGGISKTEFVATSLYIYNPETRSLFKTEPLKSFPIMWNIEMAFSDSMVYYSITPTTAWEESLQNAETKEDSLRIYDLQNKYSDPFVFDERRGEISTVDSITFAKVYSKERRAGLQSLYDQMRELPLSDLGFVLQEIYPKPEKEYIKDFIYASKGGSTMTTRAIAEQIIAPLGEDEIRKILGRIDDYRNSLNDFEKQQYEFYAKERIEMLEKLLIDNYN
jgi:hypothetical protein